MVHKARTRRYARLAATVVSAIAMVAAVGPIAPASMASTTWASAWPSEGGGVDNRYWNQQETAISPASVASLRERFTIRLPSQVGPDPVVADGKLFVSYEGGVSAYSVDDGRQLWTFDDAGTPSELLWLDDTLYAATGQLGAPSTLYALNSNGKQRWRFGTDDVVFDGLGGAGDTIVVSGATRDNTVNHVLAFDSTGEQLWTKHGRTLTENATVVDGEGQIFLRPWRDGVPVDRTIAVELDTGRQHWSIGRTLQPRAAEPERGAVLAMRDNGVVSHQMLSLDARTGKPRWDVSTSSSGAYYSMAADSEHSYLLESSESALVARDLDTGEQVWRADAQTDGALAGPVVAGDLVYVIGAVDDDYSVAAYRADNGERIWSQPINGSPGEHAVVAAGTLYLRDGDTIRAFSPGKATPVRRN